MTGSRDASHAVIACLSRWRLAEETLIEFAECSERLALLRAGGILTRRPGHRKARQLLRVALFITCYNDTLFPQTGRAMVRVLERLGHSVEFPAGQTCCGQMHYNTGYQADALTLLPRFVEQFRASEVVVAPSTSCVTMMRDHYPSMAQRLEATGRHNGIVADVEALLPRVFEFSEFLTKKLGLTDVGAYFPHRVTYHASCHGLRGLGLGDGPESLLRAVKGIDLVPLPDVERCCGFGGTFAVKNADVSSAMLAEKVQGVLNTGAEMCTACDNSCLMHIAGALHRQRTGVHTMHLAEILASEPPADIAAEVKRGDVAVNANGGDSEAVVWV